MQVIKWIQESQTPEEVVNKTLEMSTLEQRAQLQDPLSKLTSIGDWKTWPMHDVELTLGLWYHHVWPKRVEHKQEIPQDHQGHEVPDVPEQSLEQEKPEEEQKEETSKRKKRYRHKRRRHLVSDDEEETLGDNNVLDAEARPSSPKRLCLRRERWQATSIRWIGHAEAQDKQQVYQQALLEDKKDTCMVVSPGQLVHVGLEEGENDPPTVTRPLAKILSLYEEDGDKWMHVAWCYGGDQLSIDKKILQDWDLRPEDYCLSDHEQDLRLQDIEGICDPETIHLNLFYHATEKTLEPLEDVDVNYGGQYKVFRHRSEIDAFTDCLAADPNCQKQTTFWRRAEDIFLKPLSDLGHNNNRQRGVLQAHDYAYKFVPVDVQEARCFCCGLKRRCTWQAIPAMELGREIRETSSSSSSSKDGKDAKESKTNKDDVDRMLLGNSCHGRVLRIRDFLQAMQEFSHMYRALHGRLDPRRISNMYDRVRILLEPSHIGSLES